MANARKPMARQADGVPEMADPYPAGEVRCANLGRDNQPAGIFPDKMALDSLKASGASPVESLKLIDMIRQDGKTRLFPEIY